MNLRCNFFISTYNVAKESATLFNEGDIMRGLDKSRFVVKKTAQGVKRWMPYTSTTLHGFHPAKTTYISKSKPTVLYERGYMDTWPKSTRRLTKVIFRPTGKITKMYIEGYFKYPRGSEFFGALVFNNKTKLVSSNLLNTEAFIKL